MQYKILSEQIKKSKVVIYLFRRIIDAKEKGLKKVDVG